MKKLCLGISVLLLVACGGSSKEEKAAAYNDAIIEKQVEVVYAVEAVVNSFESGKDDQVTSTIKAAQKTIKMAQDSVNILPPFEQNDTLKNAFLIYLQELKKVVDNDYVKLAEIVHIPDSIFSQDDQDLYLHITAKADSVIRHAERDFMVKQEHFAKENGFVFEE